MKLSFSTLGCPGWTWGEIFAAAKDLGMNGIEIRGITNEMYAPKALQFNPEQIDKTMESMRRAGLEIPILASGACFSDEATSAALSEAKEYIDLAQNLGVPYVRVMCECEPAPSGKADIGKIRELYLETLDYAKGKNVLPLIETNGILADSCVMAGFIRSLNRDDAFVLWDIHHPYRYFNESPETTMNNIGNLVRHVHVKDSELVDGGVQYRLMGYGDVPAAEAIKLLSESGYTGYISLEWVKRWKSDLEEPGVVFPFYANYMTSLFKKV